jgi:hypothetical protein
MKQSFDGQASSQKVLSMTGSNFKKRGRNPSRFNGKEKEPLGGKEFGMSRIDESSIDLSERRRKEANTSRVRGLSQRLLITSTPINTVLED